MGETRVDLLHLLEDLRDAYPGAAEETILTEMVANALDSRAATVRILTDAPGATFTLVDDGEGMRRRELARYHDLATSGKTRGHGIGFAGVGIKLALLVSREVLTAAVQDRRAAHPPCPILHLAAGGEPLDADSLSADSRAHRATRVVPDLSRRLTQGAGGMSSERGTRLLLTCWEVLTSWPTGWAARWTPSRGRRSVHIGNPG